MRRFRTDLPVIIRPDMIPTDDGLSSRSSTRCLAALASWRRCPRPYARLGFDLVGGADGIVEGFWAGGLRAGRGDDDPFLAIVVSDESDAYRGEMQWLSDRLRALGRRGSDGAPPGAHLHRRWALCRSRGTNDCDIDVLYRFFELFDLKNIPKIDLILYAIRKELVQATPPLKSHLEEKLLMALLHHGSLAFLLVGAAGARDATSSCGASFPMSWVMDARPLPPHAADSWS